ncbi:MAG: hypothetical protein CM1200mP20_10100 [Pseudomonadota bacterium]|nr:MAG: hypothetical protein CM1200mP20_10100 [Pseudomonadota bacterium]
MEGYHVFSVHPQLLEFAPMNLRWSGEWLDHLSTTITSFPKPTRDAGASAPLPGTGGRDPGAASGFCAFRILQPKSIPTSSPCSRPTPWPRTSHEKNYTSS